MMKTHDCSYDLFQIWTLLYKKVRGSGDEDGKNDLESLKMKKCWLESKRLKKNKKVDMQYQTYNLF